MLRVVLQASGGQESHLRSWIVQNAGRDRCKMIQLAIQTVMRRDCDGAEEANECRAISRATGRRICVVEIQERSNITRLGKGSIKYGQQGCNGTSTDIAEELGISKKAN